MAIPCKVCTITLKCHIHQRKHKRYPAVAQNETGLLFQKGIWIQNIAA